MTESFWPIKKYLYNFCNCLFQRDLFILEQKPFVIVLFSSEIEDYDKDKFFWKSIQEYEYGSLRTLWMLPFYNVILEDGKH